MPMKLTIKVGADSIEADGDLQITPEVVELTKEWVKALPPQDQREAQAKIDDLTARARSQNDALEGTVGSHPFGKEVGSAADFSKTGSSAE